MIPIHVLRTGQVQVKFRHFQPRREGRPARVADVLVDRHWSPRLPITALAVDHPEGVIVVDTGETSHANDPGYQPWWHPFMQTCERRWVEPNEEIGPQLVGLGLDPDRVRWVVMTHMHGDHAGGIYHFPQSEIVMSDTEARMALGRRGPLDGYLNMHYPVWLAPRRVRFEGGAWESFAASVPLTDAGDVRLVPTPGHTLGHLSVVVDQGDHLVLLAGDAAYSEQALLAGALDGVAQSTSLHHDTNRRIRELCRRRPVVVVPAHDDAGPDRLAARRPTAA